jgi:hypothetical protein
MPRLDMDDRASRDRQLRFRILQTTHTEEILPSIEIEVDPQVSFTQGYEDSNMQDSRGSQVVKLKAIVPQ